METELDVLARCETEIGFVVGDLECVGAGVGGEGFAVDKLDGDPAVHLEDCFAGGYGGGREVIGGGFNALFDEGGGFGG